MKNKRRGGGVMKMADPSSGLAASRSSGSLRGAGVGSC